MIRQANVILGNRDLLIGMGMKAELFAFFYPQRDFAQHVQRSLACLYRDNELIWSDGPCWQADQQYIPDTNIVHTHLKRMDGLSMEVIDFAHPSLPVLVRNYRVSSTNGFSGKFFYYSEFQPGEMQNKGSAFCNEEQGIVVHYNREHYIGLCSEPAFQEWQIGRAHDTDRWTNAIYDMQDGHLQKKREEIGRVNSAMGWELNIGPGGSAEINIFIGAASTRDMLYQMMQGLGREDVGAMQAEVKGHCRHWLDGKRALHQGTSGSATEFSDMYKRSLLTLSLLHEPKQGSFVAAPEFDHGYEMSGGYGYCWNRDTSEVVLALLNAGYPEFCRDFFKWCKKTQLSDGSWFQRYWLDGSPASSWGNFSASTQIDETGATLFAMDGYYRSLDAVKQAEFIDEMWTCIASAAGYLMERTCGGLHEPCICLWESYTGIFTYTNAAIYAGLKGAANMAAGRSDAMELAKQWLERADQIKESTIREFWLPEGYFARGRIHGCLDTEIDASILGVCVPFNMLNTKDEKERDMVLRMIRNIEKRLGVHVNGGIGIKRYENDNYIDGNPWVVTTLWLAGIQLALAGPALLKGDQGLYKEMMGSARAYIRWAQKGCTSTGMLPEQVNKHTGRPAWAIPLGWSCALMINDLRLLCELEWSLSN